MVSLAFANDPFGPVANPALPGGSGASQAFNAARTVGGITTAELRAQSVLRQSQLLHSKYQTLVDQGALADVPSSVRSATAQARSSLEQIQDFKQRGNELLDERSAIIRAQSDFPTKAENLKQLEDSFTTNPPKDNFERDLRLRQREELLNMSDAEYNAAMARHHQRLLEQNEGDLEALKRAADSSLANAQRRLDNQEAQFTEDEAAAEKALFESQRIKNPVDLSDAFAQAFPGEKVPAQLGSEEALTQSDRRVNDSVLRWGVCRLYKSVEGGMGGLFATIAGVIAIVFAVVGAFKAAWGFMLVAVGAFILRSLVSLFYGGDFDICNKSANPSLSHPGPSEEFINNRQAGIPNGQFGSSAGPVHPYDEDPPR